MRWTRSSLARELRSLEVAFLHVDVVLPHCEERRGGGPHIAQKRRMRGRQTEDKEKRPSLKVFLRKELKNSLLFTKEAGGSLLLAKKQNQSSLRFACAINRGDLFHWVWRACFTSSALDFVCQKSGFLQEVCFLPNNWYATKVSEFQVCAFG